MTTQAKIVLTAENRTSAVLRQMRADVDRTFGGISRVADGLRGHFAAMGAALAGIGAALKFQQVLAAGENLNKLAQRTGIAVEALSAYQQAAQLSDLSTQDFEKGIRALAKSIDSQSDAFSRLGLDPKKFQNVGQAIEAIAERFRDAEDGARKSAVAQELFGKSGEQWIPLLNQGGKELARFAQEARDFGSVIDTGFARQAEAFNDNLKRLSIAANAAAKNILAPLLPALNDLAIELLVVTKRTEGLWEKLNFFAQQNPFASTGENLARFGRQLDDLIARRAELAAESKGSEFVAPRLAGLDQEIAALRKRIEILKEVRREQILARTNDGQLDARDLRLRQPQTFEIKSKDETGPDLLRAQLALRKTLADAQLAVDKDEARRSLEIAKQNYDDKLSSAREFAAAQLAITSDLIDKELATLNRERQALVRALNPPPVRDNTGAAIAQPEPDAKEKLRIRAELAKLDADIIIKSREHADAVRASDQAITKSGQELLDIRRDINDELARAQGQVLPSIDTKALSEAIRKLTHEGDLATVAKIDLLVNTSKAEAQIATFEQSVHALQDRLNTGEARIQIKVDTGQLTDQQAEQAVLDLRRGQLSELTALITQTENYARANEQAITPDMIARMDQMKLAQEQLRAATDESAIRFREFKKDASDSMQGIGRTIVDSLRSGKSSFKDFFANIGFDILAKQVEQALQQMLASVLATLASAQAASQAASSGSVVAAIVPGSNKMALGGIMTSSGPLPLQRYATGGIATRPQLALFGEGRQHEAFVPLPDGRRIPVALQGGGGMTLNMNITTPEIGTRKSQTQLLNEVTNAMAAAQRRR